MIPGAKLKVSKGCDHSVPSSLRKSSYMDIYTSFLLFFILITFTGLVSRCEISMDPEDFECYLRPNEVACTGQMLILKTIFDVPGLSRGIWKNLLSEESLRAPAPSCNLRLYSKSLPDIYVTDYFWTFAKKGCHGRFFYRILTATANIVMGEIKAISI